jgi:hypothetical protein
MKSHDGIRVEESARLISLKTDCIINHCTTTLHNLSLFTLENLKSKKFARLPRSDWLLVFLSNSVLGSMGMEREREGKITKKLAESNEWGFRLFWQSENENLESRSVRAKLTLIHLFEPERSNGGS